MFATSESMHVEKRYPTFGEWLMVGLNVAFFILALYGALALTGGISFYQSQPEHNQEADTATEQADRIGFWLLTEASL